MSPVEFEEYIAELCRPDGYTRVLRVGAANHLGADATGRPPDGQNLVVQCKRYAKHRTVGSPDLHKFNGTARSEHGADVPLFARRRASSPNRPEPSQPATAWSSSTSTCSASGTAAQPCPRSSTWPSAGPAPTGNRPRTTELS
ncbi:restriction endonuclease [Streptomyces sp. NPDC048629]|uniref:restriction endonuclease n=1 Tax=Streptomyces sp. NPDC048629 TaxID=3154824 RepID=UPI0034268425